MSSQPDTPSSQPDTPFSQSDWSVVVDKIRSGEDEGMAELYRAFSRGIRFYLCRHLGPQELEDRLHDTFLIVVQAIQRGHLRDPRRLMGFVRTVVRRQVAAQIDQAVHQRREFADLRSGVAVRDGRTDPEREAIIEEKVRIMERVLRGCSQRDREILTRFYLHGETQDQICRAMSLTGTQFRLLKSRAKARFGELGRRRLAQSHFSVWSERNRSGSPALTHQRSGLTEAHGKTG